jgi:hypothetical protein
MLDTARQLMAYGYWRAQTILRHPKTLRVRHVAPPLMLAGAAVTALTPLRWLVALGYITYVGAILRLRPKREPLAVTLTCCVFFPACQALFAAGLVVGLCARRTRNGATRRDVRTEAQDHGAPA